MSKWVKNDLKNFENRFFQVKKSNFHFISTNHSRMDCNLSSTLKSNIFAFLRSLHWGKATFTDYTRLQMTQNYLRNFENRLLKSKKSNFHFISTNYSRMYCNWSNMLKVIIFVLLRPLQWGKVAFTDYTRLQMTQTWPQKFQKSVSGIKNSNRKKILQMWLLISKSARKLRSKRREMERKENLTFRKAHSSIMAELYIIYFHFYYIINKSISVKSSKPQTILQ